MASESSSCAQHESTPALEASSVDDIQPLSMMRDFDFVERPSQDFFCPVSLELLLEPQQTSCCGNHISLDAATKLQKEARTCPMCSAEKWSTVLDKYHRRKVHEVRVRCCHKSFGCEWVGELNGLESHDNLCEKRPWECEYCGLQCTYKEGGETHWSTCPKIIVPCPNTCDVDNVERCNMEQHRSVCSLEPVACEMKEFGCSVVVPRKELATHMKESELQHLTAMTMLNLHLTKQLQQDMTQLKDHIQRIEKTVEHIENHTASGPCSACEVVIFKEYSKLKHEHFSESFYSHHHGYKVRLRILLSGDVLATYLFMDYGEYDNELPWPATINCQLELLNQAGDYHHVVRNVTLGWNWKRNWWQRIDEYLITCKDLERRGDGVRYVMNDSLVFRVHLTVPSK